MSIFAAVIFLGRPASGKSEVIDAIKGVAEPLRRERFGVGALHELDDFCWLWAKFEEDDLWERAGYARCFSRVGEDGYVITDGRLLDYCLARFNAEYACRPVDATTFIEFARGEGDGGYAHALSRLSDAILEESVICYIETSFTEACRKNEARYQEQRKHSVLAHRVPWDDMIRFGQTTDWPSLTAGASEGYLHVRATRVPFVTMVNEPECTDAETLRLRVGGAFDRLRRLVAERSAS